MKHWVTLLSVANNTGASEALKKIDRLEAQVAHLLKNNRSRSPRKTLQDTPRNTLDKGKKFKWQGWQRQEGQREKLWKQIAGNVDHIAEDRWGPRLVDADWHAFCNLQRN